jgi:phosphonate transport system substrate-binding protein
LRVGTVNSSPVDAVRDFHRFAQHLNPTLAAHGMELKAVAVRSLSEAVRMLEADELQVFIDSPLIVYRAARNTDLEIIGRRWKKGVAEYHSVFIARNDAAIETPQQLVGKALGFEAPSSSASYLLPKAALLELGLPIARGNPDSPDFSTEKVNYSFTGDDETTLVWVLDGKIDAGALNNVALDRLAGARRDELAIVHRTEAIPRHLVACTATIAPEHQAALRQALFTMHDTAQGRDALAAFSQTSRFDAIGDEEALRKKIRAILVTLGD